MEERKDKVSVPQDWYKTNSQAICPRDFERTTPLSIGIIVCILRKGNLVAHENTHTLANVCVGRQLSKRHQGGKTQKNLAPATLQRSVRKTDAPILAPITRGALFGNCINGYLMSSLIVPEMRWSLNASGSQTEGEEAETYVNVKRSNSGVGDGKQRAN